MYTYHKRWKKALVTVGMATLVSLPSYALAAEQAQTDTTVATEQSATTDNVKVDKKVAKTEQTTEKATKTDSDVSDTVYQLDPIIVTASGYEENVKNAPASVTVITKEDIAKKGVTDLGDILSDIEGVDVLGARGRMGTATVSMRGMGSEYTAILVDGVAQNGSSNKDIGQNGFYNQIASSFIPPISSIERIEVVRGPMSTLYGSDAIGGVINIITKKVVDKAHTTLSVDRDFYTASQDKNRAGTTHVSLNSVMPIVPGKSAFTLRGQFAKRGTSFDADDSASRGSNETPPAMESYNYGGKYTWKSNDDNTYWIDASIGRSDLSDDTAATGFRFDRNIFTLGSENVSKIGTWTTTLTRNTTEMLGYGMTVGSNKNASRELKDTNIVLDTKLATNLWDNHKVVVGGKYWKEQIDDGLMKYQGFDVPKANVWDLFAEDTWSLTPKWDFTYGARFSHSSTYSSHTTARGYLVYKADDKWTIKGGVAEGYKVPTVAQGQNGLIGFSGGKGQIYSSVETYGNSSLKPEESLNKEIGVYYSDDNGVSANITYFDTYFKNKIDLVDIGINPANGWSMQKYFNMGRGNAHGIELATKIPLAPKLDFSLNYTYTTSEVDGGSADGQPLTATPKHALNAKFNWKADDETNIWLSTEWRKDMPRYAGQALTGDSVSHGRPTIGSQTVVDTLGKYYHPYTIWNLGASKKLNEQLTLNLAINNIFNKNFSTVSYIGDTAYNDYYNGSTGTYIAGRNYWVSLTYDF